MKTEVDLKVADLEWQFLGNFMFNLLSQQVKKEYTGYFKKKLWGKGVTDSWLNTNFHIEMNNTYITGRLVAANYKKHQGEASWKTVKKQTKFSVRTEICLWK